MVLDAIKSKTGSEVVRIHEMQKSERGSGHGSYIHNKTIRETNADEVRMRNEATRARFAAELENQKAMALREEETTANASAGGAAAGAGGLGNPLMGLGISGGIAAGMAVGGPLGAAVGGAVFMAANLLGGLFGGGGEHKVIGTPSQPVQNNTPTVDNSAEIAQRETNAIQHNNKADDLENQAENIASENNSVSEEQPSVEKLEKDLGEIFAKDNMTADDWEQAKNLRVDIAKAKGGGEKEIEIALLEHDLAHSLASDDESSLKRSQELRLELTVKKGGGETEITLTNLENQLAEALFNNNQSEADSLRTEIEATRAKLGAERNA